MMVKFSETVFDASEVNKQAYKPHYSSIVTHKDMPYNKKLLPIEDGQSQKMCGI